MSDERLRRQVDPQGIESATSTGPPVWTGESVTQLIRDCVTATRVRFGQGEKITVVTDEVATYMQGFVAGRGFDVDITDALLVALNFEPDAV